MPFLLICGCFLIIFLYTACRWDQFGFLFVSNKQKTYVISATEDLMREHGLVNRMGLIYEEIARRLSEGKNFNIDFLIDTVKLIKSFIQDYHEHLEEECIFPAFEKAKKKVDLVKTLKEQHAAGRWLSDTILTQARTGLKTPDSRTILIKSLNLFTRMYRVHEAREDTELFTEIQTVMPFSEYEKLGEIFEKREEELFGQDGFRKMVYQIIQIELELGINDLTLFTPKISW